jgi:hypothetical protein
MNRVLLNIYLDKTEELIYSFNIEINLDLTSDDFTEDFENEILEDIFDELKVKSSDVYYEVI